MFRFLFILLLLPGFVKASGNDTIPVITRTNIFDALSEINPEGGYAHIKGAPSIDQLVRLHIQLNQKQRTVPGYRVQIFSGSSYDYSVSRVEQLKKDIQKEFPDVPIYLNYFDPDFKIRAGNFKNRLDCIPTLKKIRKKYSASYPVKADIPVNDLLNASQLLRQQTEALESTDEKSTF